MIGFLLNSFSVGIADRTGPTGVHLINQLTAGSSGLPPGSGGKLFRIIFADQIE
jgi:hypothetical protein